MLHTVMMSCLCNVYYGRPKSNRTPANVAKVQERLLAFSYNSLLFCIYKEIAANVPARLTAHVNLNNLTVAIFVIYYSLMHAIFVVTSYLQCLNAV